MRWCSMFAFPIQRDCSSPACIYCGILRATAEHAHLPVLIFTGVPLSPSEEEMVRVHGGHVFYKPQPYMVLINHLNELLKSSGT